MKAASIIIPTYREAENLAPLMARLHAAMNAAHLPFEAIVVDDNSGDGTPEVMARLKSEGLPVRLIVRTTERGLSSAVLHGFRAAEGDVLVCMDADLSHPPEAVPQLVATIRGGAADFVIGSRYVRGGTTEEGWGVFRWLNSKAATLMARPLTRVKDPMAGFFALSREQFERAAPLSPIGYKIGLELLVKCPSPRVVELPIHFAKRERGSSKLNIGEQLRYLRHVGRLLRYKLTRKA